jgi:hypothetical protein
MDQSNHSISPFSISPQGPSARFGFKAAPIVVVRHDADFSGAERLVAPALTATDSLTRDSKEIAPPLPSAQQRRHGTTHQRRIQNHA